MDVGYHFAAGRSSDGAGGHAAPTFRHFAAGAAAATAACVAAVAVSWARRRVAGHDGAALSDPSGLGATTSAVNYDAMRCEPRYEVFQLPPPRVPLSAAGRDLASVQPQPHANDARGAGSVHRDACVQMLLEDVPEPNAKGHGALIDV